MRTTAGPSARTVNLAHLAVIRTTGAAQSLRTPRGDSFWPSFRAHLPHGIDGPQRRARQARCHRSGAIRSIRTANTTRSLPAGAWPIEPLAFDPPYPVVTAREAFNRSRKAWPVRCCISEPRQGRRGRAPHAQKDSGLGKGPTPDVFSRKTCTGHNPGSRPGTPVSNATVECLRGVASTYY